MTGIDRSAGGAPATPNDATRPTDEQLLAGLADGRLDALDLLYERHRTMAYSIALRITTDPAAAEDVVQEAFLGAWRHAARYEPGRGSARTWLLSIVHHRAIDAVRRRRPTTELPAPDEGTPPPQLTIPDTWEEVAGRLDREAVQAALATLPAPQREVLELAYFAGLTQTEIAERVGVPLGTVKSRVRLALGGMRRAMVGDVALGGDGGALAEPEVDR